MGDFFPAMHQALMDPDRIPPAVLALLIAALAGIVTGPPGGNANPLVWVLLDRAAGGIGDRLDRRQRGRGDLMLRGFILTVVTLTFALFAAQGAEYLTRHYGFYGLTEALLLACAMSCGAVWFALLRLYFAMEKGEAAQGAYFAISRSARVNLAAADNYSLTRAGMNYAGRSFDKGLVAPVFWYLLGGLPLALIYAVLGALAWRFGKDGFSKGFGGVPLALEKLMGFAPSLLAAGLLAAAAIVTPTARSFIQVLGGLRRDPAPYEQGGRPLAAIAWALDVKLGGPAQDLAGSALRGVWIGPESASARLTHKHLRRVIYLHVMATLLFLASLCGAWLWAGRSLV